MLDNPFDIAHETAIPLIKIEDCYFLTAQRKERLGKMGSYEEQLVLQGKRKAKWSIKSDWHIWN